MRGYLIDVITDELRSRKYGVNVEPLDDVPEYLDRQRIQKFMKEIYKEKHNITIEDDAVSLELLGEYENSYTLNRILGDSVKDCYFVD